MPHQEQHVAPRAPGPDQAGAPLTPAWLGEVYPVVSSRVHRALSSLGVSRDSVDDLLSEAVVRALTLRVVVRHVDDLTAWLVTVSRRLYLDQLRTAWRTVPESEAREHLSTEDPAAHAAARVLLGHALTVIAALPEKDRAALQSRPDGVAAGDRRAAVRVAVQRHRVRTRIKDEVGPLR